ncbi:MAG: hypothetical protein KC442_00525, partial [Thermomicrobiales bacterium]|nr:hypothetical protein [Thermomicrobiales bacterium]
MGADLRHSIVRAWRDCRTRREALGGILSLALVTGLDVLGPETSASAGGRKQKRRKKSKENRRQKRKNKPSPAAPGPCAPQAKAVTCKEACGQVKNNCKEMIDCGACDCNPECGPGKRCGEAGSCEPAAGGAGDACQTHADCLGDLI